MANTIKINNINDLVSTLADRMMQADIDCNPYQTDIYLYVEEDGSWHLEDFVNVGGNSWLNDDHICVWSDRQHFEDYLDWYQSLDEIADMLQISREQLQQTVYDCKYPSGDDCFEVSDMDYHDVCDYIKSGDTQTAVMWQDALFDAYKTCITDNCQDYLESAEHCLTAAVDDYNYQIEEASRLESSRREEDQ